MRALFNVLAGTVALFSLTGCQAYIENLHNLSALKRSETLAQVQAGRVNLDSIDGRSDRELKTDRTLSGQELRWLLAHQTVEMATFDDLDQVREVHFHDNRYMTIVPEPGRAVDARWWIYGNQVCYRFNDVSTCSVLKYTSGEDKPYLYFARTNEVGQPNKATAVLVGRTPVGPLESNRLARL